MKKEKVNIKSYTKQFYKGNVVCLMAALCAALLVAAGSLIVSWLLQQVIDLVSGYDTGFTLTELSIIAIILVVGIAVAQMISYHSKSGLIARGISQYKEFIFQELSKHRRKYWICNSVSLLIGDFRYDFITWHKFSYLLKNWYVKCLEPER